MTDPHTGRPTITYPGPCMAPGCTREGAWVFSASGHVWARDYEPPTDEQAAKYWSPPGATKSYCLSHMNLAGS